MVTLADIALARYRIAPYLNPTSLERAPGLGAAIYLKLENTQKTHSFKIRGALNAVLALDDSAREKGLIAASSGNHAQAVAFAAHLTGTRARIAMPAHTPSRKVNGVLAYDAEALLTPQNYDEAEALARQIERDEGATFVSPYNDPHVVAGAGTIGLEIIEQLPEVARVVVCVSGGGLIGGIATAVKSLRPDVEVIGVGAEHAPTMYNLFHGTDKPEIWETLAEALSGGIEDGAITIDLCKRHVDDVVLVTEDQIATAMRWLVDEAGWLVEGGGAVGVAAMLHAVIEDNRQPTVIILSGGNVDGATVRQVLGLGYSGGRTIAHPPGNDAL